MTETWLTFAIRRDGPASKQGYSGAPSRTLADIEGEVKHSTEGPLSAAFGELDRLDRRASWTFTIDANGTAYQHFPLESITWHCGVLGDRSVDTSLVGNLTLVGEEHVDRIGGIHLTVLTPAARASSVRITQEIRRLCPRVAANPPMLRRNLWEHTWLSQTACPSGLIPWVEMLTETQEDEDMGAYDKAITDAVATLKDGEFVGDGYAIYYVERKGDVPVLKRVDDSRAAIISNPRPVPLGVAMLLFHGDQLT